MVNSWSLLYDELTMNETIDDGMRPWGHSDYEFLIANPNMTDIIPNSPATPWKYNEEAIVKELLEYIRGTYNQHYSAGDDKIQTLEKTVLLYLRDYLVFSGRDGPYGPNELL